MGGLSDDIGEMEFGTLEDMKRVHIFGHIQQSGVKSAHLMGIGAVGSPVLLLVFALSKSVNVWGH